MPSYSFQCQDCNKRFRYILSYAEYDKRTVNCAHCGSKSVSRLISRVRIAKSEESRMDSIADPSALEGMEDDPKAMAKFMRKMSSEMGDEVSGELGPEFDEVVGRLESGQTPEDIEKDMPDLGGEGGEDF